MIAAHTRPPMARTKAFDFDRVDNTPEIEDSFRMRYQVYCIERGFLDPKNYPNELEKDKFDSHSLHFLGKHHNKGDPAGTARLVMHSEMGFPMQHHCEFFPQYAYLQTDKSAESLHGYAEISRLAVSRLFRQRVGDTDLGGPPRAEHQPDPALHPDISPLEAGPEIVAGLYKCMYHEGKRHQLTHLLVAMERSLRVLLRRMGFTFAPVGPSVDYYGPVIPHIATISEIETALMKSRPEVLRYWLHGLEPELHPTCAAALNIQPENS